MKLITTGTIHFSRLPIFFLLFALSACSHQEIKPLSTVIFFPQDLPPRPEKEGESMMALTSGKLILQDGCLRVDNGVNSHLLIWAGWYKFNVEGQVIHVTWRDKTVARLKIGDNVFIGGGETPYRPRTDQLTHPIPDECKGPYWNAGNVEDLTPEQIKKLHE